MQTPLTVTFVGIAHSESLEAEIRKRAAKLDACCPEIISCHVVVGLPHRHHGKGNPFSLRIVASTRGDEIAVAREGMREELRVVIRDAFDVVQRRIQQHGDKQREGTAHRASL
jgi:ribosome-associated translation inhibitor RaiA